MDKLSCKAALFDFDGTLVDTEPQYSIFWGRQGKKYHPEVVHFEKIIKDVSWYCKKFDYRYENEPWYDSKDAVERAVRFLSSGIAPDKK